MKQLMRKHKNLLPIFLLAAICLWAIFEVLFIKVDYNGVLYSRQFSISNILAFIAVTVDIILYFYAHKYFKYAVMITVALGLIGLLNYQSSTVSVGIFFLSIQPLSFAVGLLYFIINYRQIKNKLTVPDKNDQQQSPDPEKLKNSK